MLQGIRDRAQGYIAWIIVILISIPFALWGVQEYLGPDPNVSVIEVNGEEVSLVEYQIALQDVRSSLRRRFEGIDITRLFGERGIRAQAVESLIRERLLTQAASEAGLAISDAQVAAAIRSTPAFQRDGAFSSEEYAFALRRTGTTAGRFEEDARRRFLEAQWRTALIPSAIVSESRVERLASLQSQKRDFGELTIPQSTFADVEIGDEEIARHYEENQEDYFSPEEVRLQYVVLSRDDLAAEIEIPPGTLEERYEARIANFIVPEQRQVSHILVAPGDDEVAARARVEDLRERILAGEAFAAVAREASEDPGSAAAGGDLGFGGRGIWDPAFEQSAFSLPVGELSEPVRSAFGFHLIQVTDIRSSRTKTFDEARADLERSYRDEQAEQAYFEQVERLSNLVFEHPDNLEEAADTLGLQIATTDYLSRAGEPGDEIFGDRAVLSAAFEPDVLDGNNSEPLELSDYRTVVVRVDDRQPSRQLALDEVGSEIAEQIAAERAREEAREHGLAMLERLRAGESPESVETRFSWSEPRTIGRDDPETLSTIRDALFAMPRPETGGTTYDGVAAANGDFVLLALHRVIEEESESLDTLRDERSGLAGIESYEAFVAGLRERAEIRIFEDRIALDDELAVQ